MSLPYDYSRCVGQTDWQTKSPDQPEQMNKVCNDCRRREPGHPDRQVYLKPNFDRFGRCDHKIGPA